VIFALLWVLAFGSAAAAVDARTRRLPNKLTGPAYLGAVLPAAIGVFRGHGVTALTPIAAGMLLAASYLAASILTGGGLGLGDVKLAAGLGTALGYFDLTALLVATFVSTLSASILVLADLVTRAKAPHRPLAFGPHMMLGYVLATVFAAT
jgi:leader peptidase (prepilin peptidase) / N-methyltransferase